MIGFLGVELPDTSADRAFHLGLKQAGYVGGDNVTILYRLARCLEVDSVRIDEKLKNRKIDGADVRRRPCR